MPKIYEGTASPEEFRFAIVVSKYNSFITDRLLQGALEALSHSQVPDQKVDVFKVPGAFEIPQMARKIAEAGQHNAIICLGALLRGKTLHFQLISEECARGIQNVASDFGIPVTFGVITADTVDQAVERAGSKSENKGWEAAIAALEMATLYKKIDAG